MSEDTRRSRKRRRCDLGETSVRSSSDEESASGASSSGSERHRHRSGISVNYVFSRGASTISVLTESYARVSGDDEENNVSSVEADDESDVEWQWETPLVLNTGGPAVRSNVKCDNREVWFHREYSCGTAAARGSQPIADGQHYWEIKMMSPVYGTDMMIGVCTDDLDLNKCTHKFCSLLGQDGESWGLSYTGIIQHNGVSEAYCPKFGQNAVIGVHLDMWAGTLSYYKNGRPLGVAARGLQGKKLYPVVCSTAARTGMKIVKTRSFPSSLQFLCCERLRKCIPKHMKVSSVLELPPGLRHFLRDNLSWLLDTTARREQGCSTCTTGTQTNITFDDITHVRGSRE